jgi:hypothetical protein
MSDIDESMKPETMVSVLNVLYSAFDVLCHLHDVYKVETVGTVYMIVAGCPHVVRNHAQLLAHLGTCYVERRAPCTAPPSPSTPPPLTHTHTHTATCAPT